VDRCGHRGGVSYHGCGPNNDKQPNSPTTISYVNALDYLKGHSLLIQLPVFWSDHKADMVLNISEIILSSLSVRDPDKNARKPDSQHLMVAATIGNTDAGYCCSCCQETMATRVWQL